MDLVVNLFRAEMENRQGELKARVVGYSVAVLNALDNVLGDGRGRILEGWLKALDGESHQAPPLPEKTRDYFGNKPVIKR